MYVIRCWIRIYLYMGFFISWDGLKWWWIDQKNGLDVNGLFFFISGYINGLYAIDQYHCPRQHPCGSHIIAMSVGTAWCGNWIYDVHFRHKKWVWVGLWGSGNILWRFRNVMDQAIYDKNLRNIARCDLWRSMTLFEIVINTALWRFFSDLWRNLIVMNHQIFCSVRTSLNPCFWLLAIGPRRSAALILLAGERNTDINLQSSSLTEPA